MNPLSGNVSTSCKDVRFGAKVKTSPEEVLKKYGIPSLSRKKSIDSFKRTSNNDVDLKEIQNHKEKHSEVLNTLKKLLSFGNPTRILPSKHRKILTEAQTERAARFNEWEEKRKEIETSSSILNEYGIKNTRFPILPRKQNSVDNYSSSGDFANDVKTIWEKVAIHSGALKTLEEELDTNPTTEKHASLLKEQEERIKKLSEWSAKANELANK